MKTRPNKKTLTTIIEWMKSQGITLYTGAADLKTGQRDFGCMDVTTADEVITIYKRNKYKSWKDPRYTKYGRKT
jgi:hypothetical protein